MLNIDIIAHCNFKCFFCEARNLKQHTYMDFGLYKRIVDEAIELGITSVMLTPSLGEPFLHPHIYEMIEYATERLDLITLVSNATAIDVSRLVGIERHKLFLMISQYGRSADEFVQLTNTSSRMYNAFERRIDELDRAGIRYTICMREVDYKFNYDETKEEFPYHDISVKCKYHRMPKISPNGDIAFCRFISDNLDDPSAAVFANLNHTSLKHALTDPIRYKFFDSQSICAATCNSSNAECGKVTVNSYKLMLASKQNYITSKLATDQQYADLERKCLQSS